MIVLYFLFIVLADIVAARWMIPVLPGISAPAGVLFVGPVLTIRDQLHDKYGTKKVIGIILVASIVSWAIGGITNQGLLQSISIASAIAFICSELIADTGVYALLEKKPWFVKVFLSNLVSAPVDSILFIGLAFGVFIGQPFWSGWTFMVGQIIAKIVLGTLWALGVMVWKKRSASTAG
jgi:uncharacterized PurR-regulated membrane protein YhhQ (DUF165 family)